MARPPAHLETRLVHAAETRGAVPAGFEQPFESAARVSTP